MTLPLFDEIHIISDLHMGGVGDFQILRETRRLAAFISYVADTCRCLRLPIMQVSKTFPG